MTDISKMIKKTVPSIRIIVILNNCLFNMKEINERRIPIQSKMRESKEVRKLRFRKLGILFEKIPKISTRCKIEEEPSIKSRPRFQSSFWREKGRST
jgi:hypothetical protein